MHAEVVLIAKHGSSDGALHGSNAAARVDATREWLRRGISQGEERDYALTISLACNFKQNGRWVPRCPAWLVAPG